MPQDDEEAALASGQGPLHIALLSRSVMAHRLGGMETHGEALRRWLVAAGHRVTSLTTPLPQGPATTEDAWGVTHYLADGAPGAYSRAWGAALIETLLTIHERDPFDVIASQSAAAFPYLAARRRLPPQHCIPTVLMSHGTIATILPAHLREGWRRPVRTLLKRLPEDMRVWWNDRRHVPLAERITTLSDADKAAICRMFAIKSERVTVIPNGVDTGVFSPSDTARASVRARLGLADDEIAIAVLASLEPRKGQRVMLDAVSSRPLRDAKRRIRLVLIGAGPAREALGAQARRLGLAEQVVFTGAAPHDEVAALLNGMDIIALPSLVEAMPLSLLEAMACGRAVIASRVGAVESLVTHEITGLLVPAGDSTALALAVDRLVRNPDFAKRLGECAREEVMARRDQEQTMRQYENVFKRIAAQAI